MINQQVTPGILPKPTVDNGFVPLDGREVRFLLGTDVHIGDPDTCEQRVAITPLQAGELKQWLNQLGVKLSLFVVKDAGARAGFSDNDYRAVGATIVAEPEIPTMEPGFHLVHALKEPTDYEADIPGPYLRIGALHSGDFRSDCGLAKVLVKAPHRAIFDGSAVGGFAYSGPFPNKPKFRIPLRSSMSVYAGWLAGEDVGNGLGDDEKVVVSGGGVVGTSAVNVLLEKHAAQLREVLIIEKFPERCAQLREQYRHHPQVMVKEGFEIEMDDIQDAKGLILTIFIQGSGSTPKVVDLPRLELMSEGGDVVDVAIDEGGGVHIPREDKIDPTTGLPYQVTVEEIRETVESLPNKLRYHADNHMPRRRPREASIEHGKTALMYLGVLLYLCASETSVDGALDRILDQDYIEAPAHILQGLMLDLKHGLAFTHRGDSALLYRHVLKKSAEIRAHCLKHGMTAAFV